MIKKLFLGLMLSLVTAPAIATPPRLTDIQAAMAGINVFAECGSYVAGGEPRPVWIWREDDLMAYVAIDGKAYPMHVRREEKGFLDLWGDDYRVTVFSYDQKYIGYDFERQAAIVVENVVTGEKSTEHGLYFSVC